MNFNEYQKKSQETWIFDYKNDEMRSILGLVGESGEIAEKYKKMLRGDKKYQGSDGRYCFVHELFSECGGVLYYLARICDYGGFSLEEVTNHNIEKLQVRKKKGTIKGSGDER